MNNEAGRKLIYLFVLVALALPLIFGYRLPPARLQAADKLYQEIENTKLQEGDLAFVAIDFGPNTKAENESQARVVIEHLFRKRIPVAFFSLIPLAEPYLKILPESIAAKLSQENPEEEWVYGRDWINLGYRAGAAILLQSIPKSDSLAELFKVDALGNNLQNLPLAKNFKTIENIKLLAQFTGYVGVFDRYLQFFQKENYRPVFTHGCTSITIPEAYIYLDSGQLKGLLEGIAGAAWYSELLNQNYPQRIADNSQIINTGLGVAHLVIIFFILAGNLMYFLRRKA